MRNTLQSVFDYEDNTIFSPFLPVSSKKNTSYELYKNDVILKNILKFNIVMSCDTYYLMFNFYMVRS